MRTHQRVGAEPAPRCMPAKHVAQRRQRHALVVCHVRLNQAGRLGVRPFRLACDGEVQGFIKPQLAARAQFFQALRRTPPTDRVIDGKNIWPILSGKENGHPRDAFFYYQMDQLQAVRSGDWKLFVAMNPKKRNWGKPEGKRELKLFNLASDIHEDDNLAHENPEVVKRLLTYAEAARKDLGDVDRPGEGQRKAGWVDEAMPRLLKKD